MDLKAKITTAPNLRYRTGGGALYEVIRHSQNVRHRMRMQLVQLGDVGVLNFIGMFFDHDVKLFDRVERKKTSPEVAKSEHHIYFRGRVIVLVDSESASAAEIFARVMQLEKRGTVIGDRTSGSVMEATGLYFSTSGVDYGAEITIANLIMADGQSIEHRGVNPDEVVLPQAVDLASGRDPVLAHAVGETGATISPEDAGKLFPYEWPKE